MLKRKNLKRVGTLIRIQKAGKNYAIDREYYDLKPVTGIDLTK